jgi:hypothetical protein
MPIDFDEKSNISITPSVYMVMDLVTTGSFTSVKEMSRHCDVQNKNGSVETWRSALTE